MKVTKGRLICTSDGAYSDYGLREHFRVLRDFDSAEVIAAYRKVHPASEDAGRFEAWLIREGYWEPTAAGEVLEWWLDHSYGSKKDYGEPELRENEYLRKEYAKAVLSGSSQ